MGSNMNFKGFGNDPPANGGGGRPPGNNSLMRQSSIYSLTFDEFQTTIGGSLGKDFGSMNMDELLKNIWSAEEVQSMASVGAGGGAGGASSVSVAQIGGTPATPLQRQGSLTLPRTLSQKTVDEVWRGFSKEGNSAVNNLPQRQQTLGEITLEEFLVRAGVVREDNNATQFGSKPPNGNAFFGNSNANLEIAPGLINNRIAVTNANQIPIQAANLPLNVNGVRSNQPQLAPPQQQHQQQHQQQIFPKQPGGVTYAPQLGSPHAMRGGIMGMADQGGGAGGGGMGMVGLGAAAAAMAAAAAASGSPANQMSMSSEGMKSNGDTSSVSPVPFVFNGGLRGRKCSGAVEKVVERRQRRMIKNRESAARSRARKQAYTMELEAEVAKLKEDNEELRKKQEEIMEMQKNQEMELMNMQRGGKKRCLRRTQTGPW